jgi:hypothetical protein
MLQMEHVSSKTGDNDAISKEFWTYLQLESTYFFTLSKFFDDFSTPNESFDLIWISLNKNYRKLLK